MSDDQMQIYFGITTGANMLAKITLVSLDLPGFMKYQ